MKKIAIFLSLSILLFLILIASCKKEKNPITNEIDRSEININDVKNQFYQKKINLKLSQQLNSKIKTSWDPNWSKAVESKSENSKSSYIYIPLKPRIELDGKPYPGQEDVSKTYLVIKDGTEYFRTTYFPEIDEQSKNINYPDLIFKSFTGTALFVNLVNSKSFEIQYKNGINNTNDKKAVKTESLTVVCHTEYTCTFSIVCNGIVRFNINPRGCFPPFSGAPGCGHITQDDWYLSERTPREVCQLVNIPDIPVPEDDTSTGPNPEKVSMDDLKNSMPVEDDKPKIKDIKKFIECFKDGKKASFYSLTMYVDQPVAGKSDWYKLTFPDVGVSSSNPYGVPTGITYQTPGGQTFDVGHTFVSFEKHNVDGSIVRQVLGFYPAGNSVSSKGTLKDDSGHAFDVSISKGVTESYFIDALERLETDFDSTRYNLFKTFGSSSVEYNCTDASINWMGAKDLSNAGTFPFTNTPGEQGEALRKNAGANKNGGFAPIGKGACN